MSKFKILWIDDSDRKCKRERRLVSEFIKSLDLSPEIYFITEISKESVENSNGEINRALSSRNYDLLVVDFLLSKDVLGSDIINEVRNNKKIFTDIVFYSSSREDITNSVKSSYDSESAYDYYDGVYVAPMQEEWFMQKMQFVISKIVNSWFSPNALRGVILDKTSKIENSVCELISSNYQNNLPEIMSFLKQKKENVYKAVQDKWEKLVKSPDPIQAIISEPSQYNWNLKKQILDLLITYGVLKLDEETEAAIDKLFIIRNTHFAHNKAKINDGRIEINVNGKVEIYDDARISELRHLIQIVEEYFDKANKGNLLDM